jgi:hypothetical protein
MNAPLYELAKADSAVTALLGNPPRISAFGEIKQGVAKPYAVWQLVYGSPENKLATAPDHDRYGVQVDAYADTPAAARAVGLALRDAYEPEGYIVGWNGESREADTLLYRFSFTVEFLTER